MLTFQKSCTEIWDKRRPSSACTNATSPTRTGLCLQQRDLSVSGQRFLHWAVSLQVKNNKFCLSTVQPETEAAPRTEANRYPGFRGGPLNLQLHRKVCKPKINDQSHPPSVVPALELRSKRIHVVETKGSLMHNTAIWYSYLFPAVKEAGRDFTYLIVVLIGLGVTGD